MKAYIPDLDIDEEVEAGSEYLLAAEYDDWSLWSAYTQDGMHQVIFYEGDDWRTGEAYPIAGCYAESAAEWEALAEEQLEDFFDRHVTVNWSRPEASLTII